MISASAASGQAAATASIRLCTVCGFISEGVPPPKKIERASRPGVSAARWAISVLKAATNAPRPPARPAHAS